MHFKTQKAEGSIRPDMWGINGSQAHLYIENKFWAGLTGNQPVAYIHELAKCPHPTIMLMIVPREREQTMIIELTRRLQEAEIDVKQIDSQHKDIVLWLKTSLGPNLVLTSWLRILNRLESVSAGEESASRDLDLLRSLCEAANINQFIPLNAEDLSNQMTPAMLMQLGGIIREAVTTGIAKGVFSIKRLNEASSFDGFGRYIRFFDQHGVGFWFGADFGLWKKYGTPLWFKFSNENFGRAAEVKPILMPWANNGHHFFDGGNGDLAISIHLETGVEKDSVIDKIIEQAKEMAGLLSTLSVTKDTK
jgi:hypothetical protein